MEVSAEASREAVHLAEGPDPEALAEDRRERKERREIEETVT